MRAALDRVYGVYAVLLLGVVGTVTWAACAIVPNTDWCWRLTHRMARLFLSLAGIPLTVRGLERVPSGRACVLAVNHTSYLDGLILAAALPKLARFVAKRDFLTHFVTRVYLTRIGAEFVDRSDRQRTIEDALRISRADGGHPFIFFPEGTFGGAHGLRQFRMGAFVIAARTGMPVVPVTLGGTRSALRDGKWWFRSGPVSVIFSEPIEPEGPGWNAAVTLRDRTRAEILNLCGEPDLAYATAPATKRAS